MTKYQNRVYQSPEAHNIGMTKYHITRLSKIAKKHIQQTGT